MEIGAANGDPGEDKLLRRAAAGGSQAAAIATAMAWRRPKGAAVPCWSAGAWTLDERWKWDRAGWASSEPTVFGSATRLDTESSQPSGSA